MRAAIRWRKMVQARLAEMERMDPGRGIVGGEYWNQAGRARRFGAALDANATKDPLFAHLRRSCGRTSTVLDVGAGTGRFCLALAPRVEQVIAVDGSKAMLSVLARSSRAQGISNIRRVESRWEDVDHQELPRADVVVSSYVLPLIAEAEPFLAKMDAACRGRAFVYLSAWSTEALTEPFWRHFHGTLKKAGPTYLDLVAILADLGFKPEVAIVETRTRARFATVAAAAKSYREAMVLPDTPEIRAELRHLLTPWLVKEGDAFRPPMRTMPAAIVSWAASSG